MWDLLWVGISFCKAEHSNIAQQANFIQNNKQWHSCSCNAPTCINVNPAGGGGSADKRSGFDTKNDPSIGHLIASRVLGVGTFDFDWEAPGSNLQTQLPSVFLCKRDFRHLSAILRYAKVRISFRWVFLDTFD